MHTAAVDFETYYDDECGVEKLGNWHYVHHPKFEAYMVSVETDDGITFVGHPSKAPWEAIRGHRWVSHNAGFDFAVHTRLRETGVAPDFSPPEWHCTADLCVYLGAPRALDNAVAHFYKVKVSKAMRNKMKGIRICEVFSFEREAMEEYAAGDAKWCLKLWADQSPLWPEKERRLSNLTWNMCWMGVTLDADRIDRGIKHLALLEWHAEQAIPWAVSEAPLSPKMMAQECRKCGIPVPPVKSKDPEGLEAWEDEHGPKFQWVAAMTLKRRANALRMKLECMKGRIQPNGRASYGMRYFGGHTGRWSGKDGAAGTRNWNAQNLPRGEMFGEKYFLGKIVDKATGQRAKAEGAAWSHLWKEGMEGVDLRRCLVAPKGYHFIAPDLSQIEPRVLWTLAGDKVSLEMLKTGLSPYEVHAIATMGWPKEKPLKKLSKTDPVAAGVYSLSKARVLALGYGAGWLKFIAMAKTYDAEGCFDVPLNDGDAEAFVEYLGLCKNQEWDRLWKEADENQARIYVNSWKIVRDFRKSNPKIEGLWKKMHKGAGDSVGGDFTMQLPNGRSMVYKDIRGVRDKKGRVSELTCAVVRNGVPSREHIYGGKLVENCLTKDTEVLTLRGWVELSSVLSDDLLWDGVEWVAHGGVVARGEQEVIDFGGVGITPDHKVLVNEQWVTAGETSYEEATKSYGEQLTEHYAESF